MSGDIKGKVEVFFFFVLTHFFYCRLEKTGFQENISVRKVCLHVGVVPTVGSLIFTSSTTPQKNLSIFSGFRLERRF